MIVHDPELEQSRADTLSCIDSECSDCVRAITIEGDLRYDRGRAALLAQDDGAVHIPAFDADPILLRLEIDDTIAIDAGQSPRAELIAYLETLVAELRKGGA